MLKIEDSTNREILILVETDSLDHQVGKQILRELPQFFGKNKTLILDLDRVIELTGDGFYALYDLMKDAAQNKTSIKFTNIHDNYSEKIYNLTTTSES